MPARNTDEARALAQTLVEGVWRDAPRLLSWDGVELAGALEQRLFFALRDGSTAGEPGWAAGAEVAVSLAGSVLAALLPFRPRQERGVTSAVLVRHRAQLEILRVIGRAVTERGGSVVAVRVSQAARQPVSAGDLQAPRLVDLLDRTGSRSLAGWQAGLVRGARAATRSWTDHLDESEAEGLRAQLVPGLGRIALGGWALSGVVRRLRPRSLAAFDEVGTWARLLPAVARRHGLPSIDLPHAEAANAAAIHGAGYDRMAVFGSRAAAVLRKAGVDPERIVEVGAPRFDALLAHPPLDPAARENGTRTILLAGQYPSGGMTPEGLDLVMRGALSAAQAVAPARLVVLPHPAEPPGTMAGVVRRQPIPDGVEVQLETRRGLHQLLPEAWLLVTGWSNSILEAAVVGVPSLAVATGADLPVTFVDDGIALAAPDPRAAAALARELADPQRRATVVARARAGLVPHLGPMDGRAAARAADLIIELTA